MLIAGTTASVWNDYQKYLDYIIKETRGTQLSVSSGSSRR